jgi:hypothetical protein
VANFEWVLNEVWQIAIKNFIHHNLYMVFGTYPVKIRQELTSGDEIWCGGNINEF